MCTMCLLCASSQARGYMHKGVVQRRLLLLLRTS